jgi:hypothetical protein
MGATASLQPQIRVRSEFLINDGSDNSAEDWGGKDCFLTQEVLNGIQRKSAPHEISRKRSFSRNSRFTQDMTTSLPYKTQQFLKNIGIESTTVDEDSTAITVTSHNDQKTKLVSHIFECLNALENLVQLDQSNNIADNAPIETQSTCERNTASLGKLAHELV